MSKEIEKIIFNLEGCCGMFDYMLTPEDNNLLVSYIKELQQENRQLKEQFEKKYEKVGTLTNEILYEENSKLQQQSKELYNKIDKAIELNREIDKSLRMKNTSAYIQLEDLIFEQWKMLKKDSDKNECI